MLFFLLYLTYRVHQYGPEKLKEVIIIETKIQTIFILWVPTRKCQKKSDSRVDSIMKVVSIGVQMNLFRFYGTFMKHPVYCPFCTQVPRSRYQGRVNLFHENVYTFYLQKS